MSRYLDDVEEAYELNREIEEELERELGGVDPFMRPKPEEGLEDKTVNEKRRIAHLVLVILSLFLGMGFVAVGLYMIYPPLCFLFMGIFLFYVFSVVNESYIEKYE